MSIIVDYLSQSNPQAMNNKKFIALANKFVFCKPIIHDDTLSAVLYVVLYENNEEYILKISFNKSRWKSEMLCLSRLQNILPVEKIVQANSPVNDFSRMEISVWPTYPTLRTYFLQGYERVRSLPNLDFLPLLKMRKLL